MTQEQEKKIKNASKAISKELDSKQINSKKRFLISSMVNIMTRRIETDLYSNFVSLLKNFNFLGRILNGTIEELYKDRNKSYFKNFFSQAKLYNLIKEDLEWIYEKNKDIKLTITKKGIIIYDNYKKNQFNTLLLTIHSGTWIPEEIHKKQAISSKRRLLEEDIDSHRIYAPLVLEKGGIWIDNKFSRFACDYNRSAANSIYLNNSEKFVKQIWKEELSDAERKGLLKNYAEFYFTLGHLIETYRFNIIFDGHTMRDTNTRPAISFGIKYIPQFYIPIVKSMQKKLINMNYHPVYLNDPYYGGYILQWLNKRFPDIFTFSMEVNKKLYMTKDRRKTVKKKLNSLVENLKQIFDFDEPQNV
jgi:N-formylglutamate amidohydrolase